MKVSSDTHQELTCTNLTNYYYEGVNGDEFDPRDNNATLEDFRTCNRTDPEFWNTTILQKEITGKYIYILLILNHPKYNNICKFISNLLTVSYIDYTDLRKSIVYYNLYCIWTNNVFASFIPFLSLLFFNVSIAMELNSKANRKKVST